jgi:uncharacterized protein (DUF1501 family)
MHDLSRRVFVKRGALALLALGLPPRFLPRALLAETPNARKKTIVCIFQRGAVDGLNMVVPFGEQAYYRNRRAIAVPAPGGVRAAIDLDGFFGLHPSLSQLQELWGRKELAIIHAVGSPHPTRSHFEAQDYMETAAPGSAVSDGWLNRVLQDTGCAECSGRTLADGAAHAADHAAGQLALATSPFRGVAMTQALPRALQGRSAALAIPDLERFGIANGSDLALESTFARLYGTDSGDAVAAAGSDAFEAMTILKNLEPGRYRPRAGVTYPAGDFGKSLRQIAQLIKADVGLEIAFTDIKGWDTHSNQGAATGALATRLTELSRGMRALYDDLDDRAEDVVILTMSEFGRTVAENGSGGTDHGHANCMFVLGGNVSGGRIHGRWPGLEREQLYEGRDLELTTDFRDVFAEVAATHLGATGLDRVFPDYAVDRSRFFGLVQA